MKISAAIKELEKVLHREGDIDFTAEGFFGEVLPAKLHVRHRCLKQKAYHCPALGHTATERGPKVLQVSHL